jgi:hypothetical protein
VSLYGTSTVKRLSPRQVEEFGQLLLQIIEEEQPTSVRGVHYRAIGFNVLDKDSDKKRNNYRRVQRRALAMHRKGTLLYHWITDGSRPVSGHTRYKDLDAFFRQAAGHYRKELLRQAGEDPPDDQYLARVGYAAERSRTDEQTQRRVVARIVERWPSVRLSFNQALTNVREEGRDEDFELTKADALRLAKRRSERTWKEREVAYLQRLESKAKDREET